MEKVGEDGRPGRGPAKRLAGPLEDVLVIDLTRVLAGPFATMILRDLGATVVKIEQPGAGDEARGIGPFRRDVSAYFMSINRGKKSVTVDLKKPQGREILLRMVARADVVVENFRGGVMERLGLGYEVLRAANPRVIYASCSGFGHTGPYAARPAYDMIVQGMSGIISITGEEEGPPVRVGTSIGDLSAALFTTVGILTALHQRHRTGEGQAVDVAMLDSLFSLLESAIARYDVGGEVPRPLGSRHPVITPFEVFPTRDGHVVIAICNNKHWSLFCEHIGRADLTHDPRFSDNKSRTETYDVLLPPLREIVRKRTSREWIEALGDLGVPCGPLNSVPEVMEDPQIRARGMVAEVEHARGGIFRVPACPVKLSKGRVDVSEPAPDLGEHTEEVLTTLLGYSKDEIARLRREQVI